DKKFSGSFANITAENRKVILQEVVNEQKDKNAKAKPLAPGTKKEPNFFQLAKELTMLGYFTSEIGAKQALAYVAVPGRYEGCTPIKPQQKAWAL
ncbi:MAG: gluconate 2-dehydrogenase subunit 3 family protein, partial [Chitinophagaceae bacterium]